MSTPLPLPSKAAIRALRGIALGTSCAIGAIVEDRRRRISTLETAVANKKKLRSARQYHHGSIDHLAWQFDGAAAAATAVACDIQWHERERHELGKYRDANTAPPTASESADLASSEARDSFEVMNSPKPTPIPLPSPPYPSLFQPPVAQHKPFVAPYQVQSSLATQSTGDALISNAVAINQTNPSAALERQHETDIISIENILSSADKGELDRAIWLVMSNSATITSSPLLDRWLRVSAQLSSRCLGSGRWKDASQILTTIIELGPLDEAHYFAHHPLRIIEFHLRRPDPDTPCSAESVTLAANIFLAKLKDRQSYHGKNMEYVGRLLVLEALLSQRFALARRVYWRLLGWSAHPMASVRWAIYTFFRYNDYKSVIKIFLLHYSHMEPTERHFDKTMDYVIESIEAMKGSNATSILEAFARIQCPNNKRLRTQWVMRLLRADWNHHEDMSKTVETFDKAVSLGLLDKVPYPQGLYRTLVEIAVKEGHEDIASAYSEKLIRSYPDMKDDISLKLMVLRARAGDWDSVIQIFRRVRPRLLANPARYRDAFVLALKIFAESHSASETQEFAMLFNQIWGAEMGSGLHPYMVTLVAKKYGETRDMEGFVAWLEFCSREGFVLDAGFCNSVLHNCSTIWQLSYQEVQRIHTELITLNPNIGDEVTQRILRQAAHRGHPANRVHRKVTIASKLSLSGRSTNKREIYEAMNQELIDDKPARAAMIYQRAIRFGMPFSSHCLRLAVLAALRAVSSGSDSPAALRLIQNAHTRGHDVRAAVSTFIRYKLDAFYGSAEDTIIHMRNLINGFESSQIVIDPAVLTHMAMVCVRIKQFERAIALCNLARHRSGMSHICFSKQSFKALTAAYSNLFDVKGLNSIIDALPGSPFSGDQSLMSHLGSIRRQLKNTSPNPSIAALLEAIERGIQHLAQTRAEARQQGQIISRETIRIVQDALRDPQRNRPNRRAPLRYYATRKRSKTLSGDAMRAEAVG
ncbi:hypothetical protein F5Y14DRAFT_435272 [Nemania sp. NC0429]|nr:hypothetical protein F5Y14DRAFT_435272 [Nemania sp. NC0429]